MRNQTHRFTPYNYQHNHKQSVIYNRSNYLANNKSPIKFTVIPQNSNKFYSVSCPKTISGYNTSSSSIISPYFMQPQKKQQSFMKSSAYFGSETGAFESQSSLFRSQCADKKMQQSQISSSTIIKPNNIIIKYSSPQRQNQHTYSFSQSYVPYHAKIDDFFGGKNKPLQNIYVNKLKESDLLQKSVRSDKSQTSKKKIKVTLAGDIYYGREQIVKVRPLQKIVSSPNLLLKQNYFQPTQKVVINKAAPLNNEAYYNPLQIQKPKILSLRRPLSQLPIMASKQRRVFKSKQSSKIIKFHYLSSPVKVEQSQRKIKLSSFHLKNPAKSKLKRKESKQSNKNLSEQSKQVKINIIKSQEINDQYFPQFKIKKKKNLKKDANKLSSQNIVENDRRNTFIDKLQILQIQKQSLTDYGLPLETIKQSKYSTCSKYTGKIMQPNIKPFTRTIKLSSYGVEASKKRQVQKLQQKFQKQNSKISNISDYEMNSENHTDQLSLTSRQQTNSIFSKEESSNETHDEQLARKIKNQLNLNFSYKRA